MAKVVAVAEEAGVAVVRGAVAVVAHSTSTVLLARRTWIDYRMKFNLQLIKRWLCSDSEKKIGQGWGHEEGDAELKAETAAETDAKAEATEGWGAAAPADAWGDAPAEAPAADAAPEERDERSRREREPEEEDNTLTLGEYLKQQKEKELEIVPKLETRKANEGDDSIWKDAVAVGKKDEDEDAYFVGKVMLTSIALSITPIDCVSVDQECAQGSCQEGREGFH
jgi:hypothetical protein